MGDYGRLFLSIPNTGSRAVVTEMATNDTSTVSAVGTQNNHQGLGTKGSLGYTGYRRQQRGGNSDQQMLFLNSW